MKNSHSNICWLIFLFAACVSGAESSAGGNYLFRFGAVADCQYCNATSKVRKYSQSPAKLTACVEHYNKLDLAFVVHLGDFIDRDKNKVNLLGNHEPLIIGMSVLRKASYMKNNFERCVAFAINRQM